MPTYKFTDPATNKVYRFSSDSELNDQELAQAFQQVSGGGGGAPRVDAATKALLAVPAGEGTPVDQAKKASTFSSIQHGLGVGGAKGLLSTIASLGQIANTPARWMQQQAASGWGMGTPSTEPVVNPAFAAVKREFATPQGGAEKVGFGVEQAAEFIPAMMATGGGAAATQAPKVGGLLNLLRGMATGGAKTAGITMAQTADPETAAKAGALGAAVPGVVGATQAGARGLTRPLINTVLGATSKAYERGKNPAQAIVQEGITGSTRAEIGTKVQGKLTQLMGEKEALLASEPMETRAADILPSLKPVREAITDATRAGDKAVAGRLKEAMRRVLGPKSLQRSLEETFVKVGKKAGSLEERFGQIKGQVKGKAGDLVASLKEGSRTTVSPKDLAEKISTMDAQIAKAHTPEVKIPLLQARRELKLALEKLVPEVGPLNQRIRNLTSAARSLERRGLQESAKGLPGTSLHGGLFDRLIKAVVERTAGTPGTATRAAQFGRRPVPGGVTPIPWGMEEE
jgi:hypothetical protein